jgi:hypothetical protein
LLAIGNLIVSVAEDNIGRLHTCSWFGRNRRLAKDFENLVETLVTFVTLASIQLALGRLARAKAVTQQTAVGKCTMTKVGK